MPVPEIDAERLLRSLMTTGVPAWFADESESPAAGPFPDAELSRLNIPITEFFCLGLAIPPDLRTVFHNFSQKIHSDRWVIERLNGDKGKWFKQLSLKLRKGRKKKKTNERKIKNIFNEIMQFKIKEKANI